MLTNQTNVRKGLYVACAAAGLGLMVFGVTDVDTVNSNLIILAGLLLGGQGGVSLSNLNPKPATLSADQVAQVVTSAIEARDRAPFQVGAVEAARLDLEQALGRHRADG